MFDIDKIFQHFGLAGGDLSRRQAIKNLQHRLKLVGRKLSEKGAEQWFSRKSLPASALADFAHLAKAEGRKFDLTQFITVD